MPEKSLYYSCLKTISNLLINRQLNERSRHRNPFQLLPSKVLDDLVTTTLEIQTGDSFKAASLELLLTTGKIREFNLHSKQQVDQLVCLDDATEDLDPLAYELKLSLKSLSTACRNLEVLILTDIPPLTFPEAPRFMAEFIRNSPNLKYIHSQVTFDLKALRHCKDLKTVMLHFSPYQNICDFLKNEHGCIETLKSLEVFTICYPGVKIENDDLITILQHCPALISFGMLNTSGVLAELHRTSVLPQVNLRCCCWGKNRRHHLEIEWIRDAMIYHPFVEELDITVYCGENITSISTLTNLVYLHITFRIREDLSELFCNSLKVIGAQLKYLSMRAEEIGCPVDVSMSLENCVNLEVLVVTNFAQFTEFAKPSITLPKLKYLHLYGANFSQETRLLSLFSGCNNLIKLKSKGFDDEILNEFLSRNSLLNLKAASFIPCRMTKLGFKNLFLNTPELEMFEAADSIYDIYESELEWEVRQALLETNHKALFIDSYFRKRNRWIFRDSNFGIFDEFIFRKKGCYKWNLNP